MQKLGYLDNICLNVLPHIVAQIALCCHLYVANTLLSADEAGFEVLVGSEAARIPSALYNEKVYVMSKGFIKKALTSPLQGMGDIIHWLYSSQEEGPKLLRRTAEDARSLVSDAEVGSTSSHTQDGDNQPGRSPVTFSAGALILLRRNLEWLEDYLSCGK